MRAKMPFLCLLLLALSGVAQAQQCEEYFESSLRLASQLEHPAEFRVRMGTVLGGQVRGEQLFGAGRVMLDDKRRSLQGGAYFHWVERRDDREPWTAAYRLIRREEVHIVVSREGHRVFIDITGGQKPVRIEPHCSGGTVYALDSSANGPVDAWIFNFPFPTRQSCCETAVLTQHNDIGRSGADLNETALTPAAVRGNELSRFGHLFTLDVNGQVYAQPLYVPNVKLADGTHHNVLYVVTANNYVYAFDADSALDTKPILPPVQLAVPVGPSLRQGWYVIYPNVGIIATPVIDLSSGKMYVAAKTVRSTGGGTNSLGDEIFVLDITSLKVVDSAAIGGSYGGVPFNSNQQKSRPGLLLLNGRVYVGFGSMDREGYPGSSNLYHGWIFSFDASHLSSPPLAYNTTPNYAGGGVWQSGGGLASDGTYIYANTGNGGIEGQNDFQPGQLADSLIKLNSNLTLAQSFTPSNAQCLDTCDLDLASAGPVLLPNSGSVLTGGKEGIFYVFSKQDISKPSQCAFRAADQPNQPSGPYCSLSTDQNGCELPDPNKYCNGAVGQDWHTVGQAYSNIHGSPVILPTGSGTYQVYVWAEENYLKMFKYSGGQLLHAATAATGADAKAPPSSMPGGMLSLSAAPNGQNPVIWGTVPQNCVQAPNAEGNNCTFASAAAEGAIDATVPGIFAAFDANTMEELWADRGVGYFAKFSPPTIADGKVFVANFGDLSDDCGGNYNHQNEHVTGCGHIRVYGLSSLVTRVPIELLVWPYFSFDPGPLTPGEQEEAMRRPGD
jgi:hypothetical protein